MSDDLPYRPNVGAVLFRRDGHVLVCRRAGLPPNHAEQTGWQWPQGGIDAGEDPAKAVTRELREEIGTDHATIIGEHPEWLNYDFPPDIQVLGGPKGRFRGQRQKWFALRFDGTDADIRLDTQKHVEFDAWRWELLSVAALRVVAWKRPVYMAVAAEFERFSQPHGDR